MKIRYEVVSPDGILILGSLTFYGDHDEEADRVLMWIIRQCLSIVRERNGANCVTVRRTHVDT